MRKRDLERALMVEGKGVKWGYVGARPPWTKEIAAWESGEWVISSSAPDVGG